MTSCGIDFSPDFLLSQNGKDANCGNPLSKDYLHKMEGQTLTSAAGYTGQRIITINSMTSFWRSARNRIMYGSDVVVKGDDVM